MDEERYLEKKENERSLYDALWSLRISDKNPDLKLEIRAKDHRGEETLTYHVLDSTVTIYKDQDIPHRFVARTLEQIEEAKSRLEELTGIRLIDLKFLSQVRELTGRNLK